MNYEKKYKEALERARDCHEDKNCFEYLQGVLENIFPELKDSEDERARKEIFHFVLENTLSTDMRQHRWLAWLEKQKPIEHFELKAGHWYICHRPFCCRADHLTVKEGEKFMCEKDGVVKGFIIEDPEKYFKESNPPAPYEEEQKPKWTEEDEIGSDATIELLEYFINYAPEFRKPTIRRSIDWLKSIKKMEEQQ